MKEKAVSYAGKAHFRDDTEGIDYRHYRLNWKQIAAASAAVIVFMLFVGWLFYRSVIPAAASIIIIPFVLRGMSAYMAQRRSHHLSVQFCDAMKAYSSALRAGYSPERGLAEAVKDLTEIYGEGALMAEEIRHISVRLSLGESIEEGMSSLGRRSGIKDVEDMAEIFSLAKRGGGSLAEILKNTVFMMEERERVESSVRAMLTGKRLEQRLMYLMPAGILIYINATEPDLTKILYEGTAGHIVMTGILAIYIGTILIGERILRFSV